MKIYFFYTIHKFNSKNKYIFFIILKNFIILIKSKKNSEIKDFDFFNINISLNLK